MKSLSSRSGTVTKLLEIKKNPTETVTRKKNKGYKQKSFAKWFDIGIKRIFESQIYTIALYCHKT